MSTLSSHSLTALHTPGSPDGATESLDRHLSATYVLAQESRHVFASPLGPLPLGDGSKWMPRFVFFGPNTHDESWRLSILAGFDGRDLRATHSLLNLIQTFSQDSGNGYGLNLTFFPLVDVAGVAFGATGRQLELAHWSRSRAPEIALLESDARTVGYHGYIRVETVAGEEELISVRMRAPAGVLESPDVELISSADFAPFATRFERLASTSAADGPLSIADDLPIPPFELTFCIPAVWSTDLYQRAVTTLLTRFILRYRAFQAYGQHL
jgi:hypothetical protein